MGERETAAEGGGKLLRDTVSTEEIRGAIQSDPHRVFDQWPIREVRKECLKRLLDSRAVESVRDAEWAERHLGELVGHWYAVGGSVRDIWRDILEWYLFHTVRGYDDLAVRALEFAIKLAREDHKLIGEVSKVAVGRVVDRPKYYWDTPSLPAFLETLLATEPKSGDRFAARRAVRLILEARDTTFLQQIEGLAARWVAASTAPMPLEQKLTYAEDLGFLQQAIRLLGEHKAVQNPSLNATLGAYLREKAGLEGEVLVRLEYLTRVAPDPPSKIQVKLQLTRYTSVEYSRFRSALDELAVEFAGEGFSKVEAALPATNAGWGFQKKGRFGPGPDAEFICEFSAVPTRGNNRFWLTFLGPVEMACKKEEHISQEKREIAKCAGYIFCGQSE